MKFLILVFLIPQITFASDCASGMVFNDILNRCVTSAQQDQINQETQACAELEDKTAQESCYLDNANEALAGHNSADSSSVSHPRAIPVAMSLITMLAAWKFKVKGGNRCKATSAKLLVAGAGIALLGELYSSHRYSKALDSAEKKFDEIAKAGDYDENDQEGLKANATDAQVAAFDALIEREKALQVALKYKKKAYQLSTALYLSAGVASLLEASNPLGTASSVCQIPQEEGTSFLPSLFISDAYAKSDGDIIALTLSVPALAAYYGKAETISDRLMNAYQTPYTRAAFSATLTYASKSIQDHLSSEEDKTNKRINILNGLKLGLINHQAITSCTPDDRQSVANPLCYCFDTDGSVNPSRSNSQTCSTYFASSPNLTAGNYNDSFNSNQDKACINQANQLDLSCQCQKSNTCTKVNVSGLQFGQLNAAKVLGPSSLEAQKILDGSFSLADLDSNSLAQRSSALGKLKDQLIKKSKDPDLEAKIAKNSDKIGSFLKSNSSSPNPAQSSNSNTTANTNLAGLSPKKAIESLKDEILKSKKPTVAASLGKKTNNSSSKQEDFDLDFGNALPKGGVVTKEFSNSKNQEYDYGNNDIHSNKSDSLFKVLTNRYHRSGLVRLFSENEQQGSLDGPSQSDINP